MRRDKPTNSPSTPLDSEIEPVWNTRDEAAFNEPRDVGMDDALDYSELADSQNESMFHTLDCGHIVFTDGELLPCGTNCESGSGVSKPFYCKACADGMSELLSNLKLTAHQATLDNSPTPTPDEFKDWWAGGRDIDLAMNDLFATAYTTAMRRHRSCEPADGECNPASRTWRRSFIERTLGDMTVSVHQDAAAPVHVTDDVWAVLQPNLKELVLRKAYNEVAFRRNRSFDRQDVLVPPANRFPQTVPRCFMYQIAVPASPDGGEDGLDAFGAEGIRGISEQDGVLIAAIEEDLRRDGVVAIDLRRSLRDDFAE